MSDLFVSFWSLLDYRTTTGIKEAIAIAAAFLLFHEWWSRRTGMPGGRQRVHSRLLGVLAVAALLSWWNFGRFHFPDYVHVHDSFHYYMGAKYFPELGYTRLYACTTAADVEAGLARDAAQRWVRNLETNVLERGAGLVVNSQACTDYFSPERWAAFKQDLGWFRSQLPPRGWALIQNDHGYNATPVWGIAGRLLTATGPVSTGQLTVLGLLDPVFLIVMWGVVWWAFGWRTACVAMIFWGTYFPARYAWTGGSILRADWLALSVIGICLVKRGRMASGGFALTYATLLRIFPGAIVAALALKVLLEMWRTRSFRLERSYKRFAAGSALALAVLVPASFIVVGEGFQGGVNAWQGFLANSEKHLSTHLTNNMGLKPVLSYDFATREEAVKSYWLDTPWDTWRAAREAAFERRQPIFWAAVLLIVVLLGLAVQRSDDWVALVLGVTLIPVGLQLTCYYYGILLVFGFLSGSNRWIGLSLLLLSAVSGLAPALLDFSDDVYAFLSLLALMFVVGVAVHAALPWAFMWRRMPRIHGAVERPVPVQLGAGDAPPRELR